MGTEAQSLIPIMIIDDKSRYLTHENNKKDWIAAANEMGECLKNAMTDCYLNNTVTKESYISNIQNYFSQAVHRLTFEPDMEVTLVDQYGRPWNGQSSVTLTSEPSVPPTAAEPKTTLANRISSPAGFVANIIDSGQGKVVSIAFQEVVEALGYRLYVDGNYMRDIPSGINIPTSEFVPGDHTFAVTAFDAASESKKTPEVTLTIEGTTPNGFTDLSTWFEEKLKYCKETYDNASGILDWNSDTKTASVFLTANGISGYAEFKPGVDNTYIAPKTNRIFVNESLLWQEFGRVIDPPIEHDSVRDSLILASAIVFAVKGPKLIGSLIKRNSAKIVEGAGAADEIGKFIEAVEEDNGAKIINSADDVLYNSKSIDKAFGKHSGDFGSYIDGSSLSVKLFEQDVKDLINTGVQKSGTWYGRQGTHIYNPSTRQWAFINADGTFNTAFKLSPEQY